jgi:nucleotide-binding universal stress UspA family protein
MVQSLPAGKDQKRRRNLLQQILVPLDGSELALATIPYVQELAQRCDPVAVTLFQVVRPPSGHTASVFMPIDADFPARRAPGSEGDVEAADHPIYRDQVIASARAEAEATMAPAARTLREAGISTQIEVSFGRPAEEIVYFAEEKGIDLIVMCTHGRSGMRRWLLGSVADKVLQGTYVPVLMVRPPGIAEWPFSAQDEGQPRPAAS